MGWGARNIWEIYLGTFIATFNVFADTPYNCEDAYQKSNRTKTSDDDGAYVIDPDGPGGVDPFEVDIFFISIMHLAVFNTCVAEYYFKNISYK